MGRKKLCLKGEVFHRLTVLREAEERTSFRKVQWICLCECGTLVLAVGADLKRGFKKSCGCLRVEVSRENGLKNTKPKSKFICKRCFKDFEVYQSRGEVLFCGGECYNVWRKEHPADTKNPRNHLRYKQWRFDVYKRDLFTCQRCNDDAGGNLNAHHILSYSRYPEYGTVLENGVTLCKSCHEEFHKLYGTRKFTDEDYYEWVQE